MSKLLLRPLAALTFALLPLSGCGAAPLTQVKTASAAAPDPAPARRLRRCLVALRRDPADHAAARCALSAATRLRQGPKIARQGQAIMDRHPQRPAAWAFAGEALRLSDPAAAEALLERCGERFPDRAACFVAQARLAADRGDEATALITLARARDTEPAHLPALALDGRWRAEGDQIEASVEILTQLERLAPGSYELAMLQSLLAIKGGKPLKALAQGHAAASLAPDEAAPHFLLARAYLGLDDVPRAQEALEAVLARRADHERARAVLGHLLLSTRQGAEAAAHFTILVEAAPDDRDHQVALSQALLMAGDPASALTWAERALTDQDPPPEALELKCQALIALDRVDEALALRPLLYDDEGRRGRRRLMVAQGLAQRGAVAWAEAEYAALIEQHPDMILAWRSYGRLRYRQRRFLEAAAIFRRGLDHHPQRAILYYDLADALEESGRRRDARLMMSRAAELDPTDADYPDELARMEFLDGEVDAALGRWRDMLRRFPRSDRTRRRLGHALLSVGRFDEAVDLLRDLTRRRPDDAQLQLQLGQALSGAGDHLAASEILERAEALGAPAEEVLPALAIAYRDLNRFGEADAAYRRAIAARPDDLDLRMGYALTLQREGHLKGAAAQIRAILLRQPNHRPAMMTLEILNAQSPDLRHAAPQRPLGWQAAQADPALAALMAQVPDEAAAPHSVVLRDERHVRIEAGKVAEVRHQRSVLIRDRQVIQSLALTQIPFNMHQPPRIIRARTLTPDGVSVAVPPAGVAHVNPLADTPLYGEGRRLELAFPALEPGAIIDYEIVVPQPRSVDLGAWWDSYVLGNAEPTVSVRYSLDLPKDQPFSAHAPALPTPQREIRGDRLHVTWLAEGLPAYSPRQRPEDPPIPAVHVSSLTDWAEVDRWYNHLFAPSARGDAALAQLTAEIVAGATDRAAQIAAVYAYVEGHIKYLGLEMGVGAYQPRPAASTVARASGDCKDMTALMVAMLGTLGIEAYPALIRPRDMSFVERDHPSPAQFSHVLLYIPGEGGDDLWLDATASMGTLRAVPDVLRDRLAFVVDGAGGQLKQVPRGDPAAHTLREEIALALTPTGGGTLTSSIRLTGDLAGKARQQLTALPDRSRKSKLQAPGFLFGGDLTPREIHVEGLRAPLAPLQVQIQHQDLDLVGVQLDGSLFYTLDVDLLTGAPFRAQLAGAKAMPPRILSRRVILKPPAGYRMRWDPLNVRQAGPGYEIQISEARGPDQTAITVEIALPEGRFHPREIFTLQRALRQAQGALPARLEIQPGAGFDQIEFLQAITEERPQDRRLGRMLARVLVGAGRAAEAIDVIRRYPASARTVEDISLLAAALVESDRFEEADEVLTALADRPDTPAEIHLALSTLLMAKSQQPMAISVIRAGLRHHPTHRDLGGRLITALTGAGDLEGAFEEASRQGRLRPDDAELHRQLGDVAVALGRAEAAKQAYRQALRHGGESARLLNNLAWLLRDSSTDRPEAIALALRATHLAPDSAEAWDTLAELWFLDGRPRAALAALDRALALNPSPLNPSQRAAYDARRRKYMIAAPQP